MADRLPAYDATELEMVRHDAEAAARSGMAWGITVLRVFATMETALGAVRNDRDATVELYEEVVRERDAAQAQFVGAIAERNNARDDLRALVDRLSPFMPDRTTAEQALEALIADHEHIVELGGAEYVITADDAGRERDAAVMLVREVLCEQVFRARDRWDAGHPCRALGLRTIDSARIVRHAREGDLALDKNGWKLRAAEVLDAIEAADREPIQTIEPTCFALDPSELPPGAEMHVLGDPKMNAESRAALVELASAAYAKLGKGIVTTMPAPAPRHDIEDDDGEGGLPG